MSQNSGDTTCVPASAVQRQFWLLQRLQPETRAYHVASVFRLQGALDIRALQCSFADLIARHEVLRTTFEERDGVLHQCIHPTQTGYFDSVCEATLPERVEVEREVSRLFDLSHGPLLRVRVWQASNGEAILAWTMHHVITDLASKDILSRELAACYACRLQGIEPDFEAQSHQYVEFVASELAWQSSEQSQRAEDYFAGCLDASTPPLALPEDFPRPIVQGHKGARVAFELDDALTEKLRQSAYRQTTKPYLLLLTAFALLLGRCSGSKRVSLGVPFTNRRRQEGHGTVGCCVSTLPLTVDFSDDVSFGKLKDQVRLAMLGHHRHQEISFDQILRRVRPARDSSRNPLYQAGFTFEHPMELVLGGERAENMMVHPGGAQLDVFLTMWEREGRCFGHIEYSTDIFESATIERLICNFETLLDCALNPDVMYAVPAEELAFVHADEMRLVTRDWNQTKCEFGRSLLMHELFLEQVKRTPDAIALRSDGLRLTYQELAERAQALALALRAEGVEPLDRVGVYMERSIEMVVSIFAILMSGAAYVPIDPDFPEQRIGYVLEDAKPKTVLGISSLRAKWNQPSIALRIVDWAELSPAKTGPTVKMGPDAAAYVLFTSGSTGRPKGVAVSHRAICNSMLWMQSAFQLGPSDVLVQTTPYSFDVSTWELLWVFIVGAQLEIPGEGVHRDPNALAELIERAQVSTIHFVPSMLQVFLEQAEVKRCRSLRRVLCIGEALSGELVRRFYDSLSCELHNLYGPTEAAVQASWWYCDPKTMDALVSIGKPIANTQFYILNERKRVVPIGVPGELYIGGVQVALEYVNRPDLTERSFVPDPWSDVPGARMYRTGDLAAWSPDGNVAFLGRTDFQVKIRGVRIELGEIESVLLGHPKVAQAVVVAREIRTGDTRLVAYIVPSGDFPGAAALRQHLVALVPDYMVPQHFVALESLPTTSNGKLDRKQLPQPFDLGEETSAPLAASSPMEARVQEVWAKHLGYREFSTQGNFFDLGGTSLLAARVVWEMQQVLGRPVRLTTMFQFPTVELLAHHLAGGGVSAGAVARESIADRAQKQREAMKRRAKPRSG